MVTFASPRGMNTTLSQFFSFTVSFKVMFADTMIIDDPPSAAAAAATRSAYELATTFVGAGVGTGDALGNGVGSVVGRVVG